MHTRAVCLRWHQYVATAARPVRAGRRTDERSTMSTSTKKTKQQSGESAVRAALAAMSPKDRAIGKRLHEIIKESAPGLTPKTWYGMPAYAKDGKVVCFFQSAQKFKTRYATLGFSDKANLDKGAMWPTAFALKELTAADEQRIADLVKKAVN